MVCWEMREEGGSQPGTSGYGKLWESGRVWSGLVGSGRGFPVPENKKIVSWLEKSANPLLATDHSSQELDAIMAVMWWQSA
jgi:hypothetical protein